MKLQKKIIFFPQVLSLKEILCKQFVIWKHCNYFELGSLIYKEVRKFVTKKEISLNIINTLISSTITNLELNLNFQLRFDD